MLKKVSKILDSKIDEQQKKKRSSPTPSNITSFFGSVGPYSKNDLHTKQIELLDFILFIAKELVPLFFIKSPFFR
jgi:hypothetical protein